MRLALVFALLVGGGVARAARPLVHLDIDACVSAPREDVRRVVGIELGTLLVDAPDPAASLTRARVSCEGAMLRIRVDDPITAKSLERTIDLGAAAPRAQSRLLTLAIVELISASWTELEANPRPRVAPTGPAVSPETRAAALETVRKQAEPSMLWRLRVMASGGGLGLFAGSGMLGGAALKVGHDHAQRIGWAVDVQAQHGNATLSVGEVSTDLLSVGASFYFLQAWRRVGLRLGAGLRGGAARLGGRATQPNVNSGTLWGAWGGPFGALSLGIAAARRLAIDVDLEGGYVASPVVGLVGTQPAVAVDGGWIGFQVGIGVFL